MDVPGNLKYSLEHEWIDGSGKVGITAFAVEQIGDIVFVELPAVGSTVEASSRATYTRALEQFVLDGTGLILGFVLGVAGLFARANL